MKRAKCKCRSCGKTLTTDIAYAVIVNKKNAYYCSREEYEEKIELAREKKEKKEAEKRALAEENKAHREAMAKAKKEEAEKKKSKEWLDKDRMYKVFCEIIGREKILNTALWREKKIWNQVATDEVVAKYLEENKDYLISVVSRIDDNELGRTKYLSAIIKNNIGDYVLKCKKESIEKPRVQVDETMYEPTISRNNKRRALEDLEDDF